MKVLALLAAFVVLFLVFTVFPVWYLISIGHAPNWAAAMYIFMLIGGTLFSATSSSSR